MTRAFRLVLVDDDDAIRWALGRKLARSGFDVVQVADAQEALGLSHDTYAKATAVVTDIMMPGMNGRELGLALRARYPSLPIVYMSGYVEVSYFDPRGLDALEGFLEKPFTDEQIWRVLGAVGVHRATTP